MLDIFKAIQDTLCSFKLSLQTAIAKSRRPSLDVQKNPILKFLIYQTCKTLCEGIGKIKYKASTLWVNYTRSWAIMTAMCVLSITPRFAQRWKPTRWQIAAFPVIFVSSRQTLVYKCFSGGTLSVIHTMRQHRKSFRKLQFVCFICLSVYPHAQVHSAVENLNRPSIMLVLSSA